MELGRVVGQVVATVRDQGLPNLTFLLIDVIDGQGNVIRAGQVAVDTIGAGEGEVVLLVRGSSARLILDYNSPMDLSVVAIVDQVTSGKHTFYTK